MDGTERDQLAQRLSALTLNDARKEIQRMDPDANMAYWRNAIWGEYHTLYLLPNEDLSITLVEKGHIEDTDRPDHAGPTGRTTQATTYKFIEARVEPLERPVKPRA